VSTDEYPAASKTPSSGFSQSPSDRLLPIGSCHHGNVHSVSANKISLSPERQESAAILRNDFNNNWHHNLHCDNLPTSCIGVGERKKTAACSVFVAIAGRYAGR